MSDESNLALDLLLYYCNIFSFHFYNTIILIIKLKNFHIKVEGRQYFSTINKYMMAPVWLYEEKFSDSIVSEQTPLQHFPSLHADNN